MRRILIMGANSAIAEATAREFAKYGDAMYLVGRSEDRLLAIASDLQIRGASTAAIKVMDAREIAEFPLLIDDAIRALGGLDTALIAHGTLSNQSLCEQSVDLMLEEFRVNALSVVAFCTLLSNAFEKQGYGTIAVISSVAGDRGRQSNYVYGAAKSTVTVFTSGLRQRLHQKGVSIVTIKPGFVDTPMTAAFKKNRLLWVEPSYVAKHIVRAIVRQTPVVYIPWFWRPIMALIRSIPEFLFKKMHL